MLALGDDRVCRPKVLSNKLCHAVSHGQSVGRCSVNRLAEDAMRAGTETRVRRRVPVVAFVSFGSPVRVAAARVRLNAITAQTSQAAFAENEFDGRCARAEFFRSACTCSMIGVLTVGFVGATVSSSSGSVVVKNAWNRQMSNNVPCPWSFGGRRSGMRRTTNRPGIWWAFFAGGERGERGSRRPPPARSRCRCPRRRRRRCTRSASRHSSSMEAIARLMVEVRRTVTETSAPARIAAPMVGWP